MLFPGATERGPDAGRQNICVRGCVWTLSLALSGALLVVGGQPAILALPAESTVNNGS